METQVLPRWPRDTPDSALVVVVPASEALVRPFRERHDPAAAAGVPAHITLLYPFKPPAEIDAATVARLRDCCAGHPAFAFGLERIERFPGVLYLAPEPAGSFRALIDTIVAAFPETPPYGGRFRDSIPHLTVAADSDDQRLTEIAGDLTAAMRARVPIRATVTEVALMDNSPGRWRLVRTFCLG